MIKLKKHLDEFKSIVNIINNITIVDINMDFSPDNLRLKVIDGTNANIVIFDLKKSFFDEYDITKNQTYTVNSLMLGKVVRHITKSSKELEIEIKNEGFVLKNESNNFLLSYYVGVEDERQIPNIPITSKWSIDSTEILDIIEGFKEFGEIFKIDGKDENLKLHVKGTSIEGETITQSKKIEGQKDEAWYGISYFSNIIELKNIFKNVEFGFSTNSPCLLSCSNDCLDFKFVLAARVDENENK